MTHKTQELPFLVNQSISQEVAGHAHQKSWAPSGQGAGAVAVEQGAEHWNSTAAWEPDNQAVYKTPDQAASWFLKVHFSEKKKTGDLGSSDLPSLGVFFVVWLVFWFCFVFGTENSNKPSPAAAACPFSISLSC